MDPANPRPRPGRPGPSLTHVQMWVLSVLAVSTLLHFAAGLVLAAFYVDDDRTDAQIGLLVLAGIFGILSVLAGAAIHRKRLVSGWLVLGLVPAVIGAYFLFRG